MILGKISGKIVSTVRSNNLPELRYLIVQKCNQKTETLDEFLIALDPMSAGIGEVVIVSEGSSARQTEITNKKPVDAVIVGIVDIIEEHGDVVYRK